MTPPAREDLNAFINQSVSRDHGIALQNHSVPDLRTEEIKAETPVPAAPPASPVRSPDQPASAPPPWPKHCPGKEQERAEDRERSSEELLADFCEAAMKSQSVSALARCYAYASKVLKPVPPLLDKATDVFLVRKAEIEEARE